MIYLYWYLGIGTVFLAVIFISHQLTKSREVEDLADLLQAADPRRGRWWWKPLNNIVVPMLAAVMILTVWPIAIYWKAKEMIDARRPKNEEPPKEFAVTKTHLLKQLSVGEIETAEVVVDPLGAAPRVPFGHLNAAWETFKKSIDDCDQIWSFSAPWTTEWGRNEVRDGYVVLRGESIGPHFLTRWVFIDKDREQGED
jgi:hypothetical protein